MIDLYLPGNENFTTNGDMPLLPISCEITAEINGAWTLSLFHPIDEEGRWKYIQETAVLRVPSFNGEQLFRIEKTEKQDSGIQAQAVPIFLDAIGDCFILDARPTNKTGQQALADILAPNAKYTGRSDITNRATAYYQLKNAMEAIAGAEENSFLNRWGGEIAYNNYEIQIYKKIGQDNGVQILYGKNIPRDGLKETVSTEDLVTRIIPKAYNGRLLPGNTPWVNSPLINNYPTVQTRVIEYENLVFAGDLEGDPSEGQTVYPTLAQLYQAMRDAAAAEYEAGADKPFISIECDMVLLSNTEEYRDFVALEKVSLGDTVHCKHNRLQIEQEARVVALTYDVLRKATVSVSIGATEKNFLDRVASTMAASEKAITKGGTVIASQIKGFIDGAETQLRIQNTVARRQDAIAILFEDLDPSSPTFGALALGTQGLQVSRSRIGDQWSWGTAITAEGIIANYIVAGILSDKRAWNYWNLDTGEFSLAATTTVGGQTVQNIANTSAAAAVNAQTQQDIFNKLTNNGETQGIYLQGGKVYINGTYIQAGQINANLITAGTIKDAANKNSWNLTTGALSTSGAVVSGGSITGATINNGSGTFEVDANGNMKASSAEIKGAIKSGSTITGSSISGGTVTGATINNGSGTFQVDASGNLVATSASITGNISGSNISGSVITTAGTRTDDPVAPGTTFDYTSSLDSGSIIFTRTGRGTSTYDGTITIAGGGVTADFPSAAGIATLTNSLNVKSRRNNQYASYGLTCIVYEDSQAGNYTLQTGSNFEIYRNGTKVWSAR